jgi:hypothetical protein
LTRLNRSSEDAIARLALDSAATGQGSSNVRHARVCGRLVELHFRAVGATIGELGSDTSLTSSAFEILACAAER